MLVVTALVVALGFIYLLLRPEEEVFQAVTTAVIQEPLPAVDAVTTEASSAQFLQAQLEIMRSPVVAESATQIMIESGFETSAEVVTESVTIVGDVGSPLVTIIAEADSPEAAVALANAVAEGYLDISQRQATATINAQLERIDAQVKGINDRLQQIEQELADLLEADEALFALQQIARDAVGEIARLEAELLQAEGEEAAVVRQRIEDYRQARQTYNDIVSTASGSPEQQALLEEQAGQVDRRARLLIRRDEIAVDAGLAPDAIALVQPASSTQRLSGLGLPRLLAVTLILGLAAGMGLAYLLSVWRRTFSGRSEPQATLEAPLLADIPDFDEEGLETSLPVRDYPRSAAAEAFRFAAATTEAGARSAAARSIFFVSSTIGHGKTTSVVNVALAAAFNGRSVVLVDCDFGNQEAARALAGEGHGSMRGVTDVVEGAVSISESTYTVPLGNGIDVALMPRGTRPSLAAAAFQSAPARQLFEDLVERYDLVLIDGPPLLQVAYAASLAEIAEALVVVVEHESRHSELVDLRGRLDLIGTPVLGYIYNRSPLRREMTMTEGSMMDILGDSGFTGQDISRRTATR